MDSKVQIIVLVCPSFLYFEFFLRIILKLLVWPPSPLLGEAEELVHVYLHGYLDSIYLHGHLCEHANTRLRTPEHNNTE
jgi:hypothetical protein